MTCASDTACPAPYRCEPLPQGSVCARRIAYQRGSAPDGTYDGALDASIYESSPAQPAGTQTTVRSDGDDASVSGDTSGKKIIGLARWTLDDELDGATVLAASIDLNITDPTIADYEVLALTRSWDESATWLEARTGEPWTVAGAGDRNGDPLGLLSARVDGPYRLWLNAQGVEQVQRWVSSPASNAGVAFVSAHYDGVLFTAREGARPESRPRLVVYYRAP